MEHTASSKAASTTASRDPRTSEQAVADELEGKPCYAHHAYLANSTYAPQVQRFIDHIGASALLVRSFHELTRDPGP
ncbi:MAG: hypothetical protein IPM46_00385 [Flavobacteriales bacterium]|nr:hypothetical protein [Flavobacteriales bacterium]